MAKLAQGQVWWADLPAPAGRRPVLILTRSSVANRLNSVIVAPITTTVRNIDSEVALGPEDGLPQPCTASIDNLVALPRNRLASPIATIGAERMPEVFRAIRYVFNMPDPVA